MAENFDFDVYGGTFNPLTFDASRSFLRQSAALAMFTSTF